MVINFRCPRGHVLKCPDELAGKIQDCPACKTKLRIPGPGESSTAMEVSDPIAFLCPNGHRLHGPVSLAGKPGECPKCHVKFQVPTLEELLASGEEYHEDGDSIFVESAAGATRHLDDDDRPLEYDELEEEPLPHDDDAAAADTRLRLGTFTAPKLSGFSSGFGSRGSGGQKVHPLAGLIQELWPHRASGVVIELHLVGGDIIEPDLQAPHLNSDTHGIFAVQEMDGTYSLVAVAWSSITRVAARNLNAPPDGMIE